MRPWSLYWILGVLNCGRAYRLISSNTVLRTVFNCYANNGQSMARGKFRPPISRKPLDRFWWNLKYIAERPPTMQNEISIGRRGWSGRTAISLPLSGFFVFFFWFLSHAHRSHQWTDFDDLCVMTFFWARMYLWGLGWYVLPFKGSNAPKTILGAWKAFSSLTSEIRKLAYHQNYCTDFKQISHADRDHQMLFVVVQRRVLQIQDVRRPSSSKNGKIAIVGRYGEFGPTGVYGRIRVRDPDPVSYTHLTLPTNREV